MLVFLSKVTAPVQLSMRGRSSPPRVLHEQEVVAQMTPLEHFVVIAGCDLGEQLIQPGVGGFGRLRFPRVPPVKDSSRHPLTRPFLRGP